MRDRWQSHLACSWYKLTVEQRGFLATIYAAGDHLTAEWSDIDTICGEYWKGIADKLVSLRCIDMTIESGIVTLKLKLRNETRRKYMREHKRTST